MTSLSAQVKAIEKALYAQYPKSKHTLAFVKARSDGTIFAVTSPTLLRNNIARALRRGFRPEDIIAANRDVVPPSVVHIPPSLPYVRRAPHGLTLETGSGRFRHGSINPVAMVYNPAHVSAALSHEKLHTALERFGNEGVKASDAIDNYKLFGYAVEQSPAGIIDPTILERRVQALKSRRLER